MKHLLLLLSVIAVASPAHAEGFSGLLRSITSAVSSPSAPEKSKTTATIGVRGMDEGDTSGAPANHEALKSLENWSVSSLEAEKNAEKRGLIAKNASYGDAE